MGILNGQPVDETITNPAFLDANQDDVGYGRIDLANTDPSSGPTVTNIQGSINGLRNYTGAQGTGPSENPDWSTAGATSVGDVNDSLFERDVALTFKFDGTHSTGHGHSHDGTDGEGSKIAAESIDAVPLKGFFLQGVLLTGVTGSSVDVSTELSGKVVGNNINPGVITFAPYNKAFLRQGSGSSTDDSFLDSLGNVVYGRVTQSLGVWTLSFYVDLSGVETSYSFPSAVSIKWYYQETYNPLAPGGPIFSELATIPSDSATADVLTATSAIQGKVQLATAAQPVGSATSAGTANAIVANANHTHEGVHSVKRSGDASLYGDVTFSAGTNVVLTQVGQDIEISSTGGSGGLFLVSYVDDTSTTLPTSLAGYTVPGNGANVVLDDIVLFTALTTGADRIYKVTSVGGGVITWTAIAFGQDKVTFNPKQGDIILIKYPSGTAPAYPEGSIVEYVTGDYPAGLWRNFYNQAIRGKVQTDIDTSLNAALAVREPFNYVSNPAAEVDTSGWTMYADGAAAPVDATGGSPTATLTRTTSTPLRGTGSFYLTPGALGNGAAHKFQCELADLARVLSVYFDYSIDTPASYTTGDVGVFVVSASDSGFTTNLKVTQLAPFKVEKILGSGRFQSTVQLDASNRHYALCIHQVTAASGYNLKFDNVNFGSLLAGSSFSKAPNVVTLTSGSGTYTPSAGCAYAIATLVGGGGGGGGTGAPGNNGSSGGTTTLGSASAYGGGGGNGGAQVSSALGGYGTLGGYQGFIYQGADGIPPFDANGGQTYCAGGPGGNSILGGAGARAIHGGFSPSPGAANSGSGGQGGSADGTGVYVGGGGAAGGAVKVIIPANVNYAYSIGAGGTAGTGTLPGAAGGSGVIIIEEFYSGSSSFPASGQKIIQVVQGKTSTAFSTSNTSMTATGFSKDIAMSSLQNQVMVELNARTYTANAANEMRVSVFKNGTEIVGGYSNYNGGNDIAAIHSIKFLDETANSATNTYDVRISSSSGGIVRFMPNGATDGVATLTLTEINPASVASSSIGAGESINGCYSVTTGSTVTSTPSTVTFTVREFDSHLAFDGTTLTIPASGKYHLDVDLQAVSNTWGTANSCEVYIYKNGTGIYSKFSQIPSTAFVFLNSELHRPFAFNAGDTVQVRISGNGSNAMVLSTNGSFSWTRVGN